jgi:uncharacterized membrane protein
MVTAAKTTSQIGVHMVVAFAIMYIVTGSVAFGGIAAILEPICNVAIMPLHEKVWAYIRKRVEARQASSAGQGGVPQAA